MYVITLLHSSTCFVGFFFYLFFVDVYNHCHPVALVVNFLPSDTCSLRKHCWCQWGTRPLFYFSDTISWCSSKQMGQQHAWPFLTSSSHTRIFKMCGACQSLVFKSNLFGYMKNDFCRFRKGRFWLLVIKTLSILRSQGSGKPKKLHLSLLLEDLENVWDTME